MPKQRDDDAAESVKSLCQGTRIAFGRRNSMVGRHFGAEATSKPHPRGIRQYGNCWRCGRSFGCSACSTPNIFEILCEPCAAWGTVEAFHEHGPVMNDAAQVARRGGPIAPTFDEYPEKFRRGYEGPRS